jgi:hypothetical protein
MVRTASRTVGKTPAMALTLSIACLSVTFADAQRAESRPESGPVSRPKDDAAALLEMTRLDALKAYDAGIDEFGRRLKDPGSTPRDIVAKALTTAITESDSLVYIVETPLYEARATERDMLSPRERGPWGSSAGIKADYQERNIVLTGVDAEGGRKVTGVASILPTRKESWRDLVVDLEFALLAGEMDMYVRYWPDKKSYRLRFAPTEGYELNKPFRMRICVKASQIGLQLPDQPEKFDRFDIDTSRSGGIGFGLSKGSKAAITLLRLKVLR